MGGPGRCGYEHSAGECLIHGEGLIGAAGSGNVRGDGRVATARLALEHIGRGQHLRGMTDGGDGLAGRGEMAHDFEHARVEAEVLRRPATRNYQPVVSFGVYLIESRIQSEVVTAL